MLFFIIFLTIPFIEISLFIIIGGQIGLLPTLLLTVFTAILGSTLLRTQGISTLFSARKHLENGELPVRDLFDGFCLVVAGVSLITPGFFTDGIGFLLLLPFFRNWLWRVLPRFMEGQIYQSAREQEQEQEHKIIDVDYEIIEEEEEEKDKP